MNQSSKKVMALYLTTAAALISQPALSAVYGQGGVTGNQQAKISFNNQMVNAAEYGDNQLLKELLKKGEDPNQRGDFETTALLRAAYQGNAEAVKALLLAGADPNLADMGGATPLHVASREGNKVVVDLLLKSGANVNVADSEGYTPLMRASIKGDGAMIGEMLKSGANIVAKNSYGETASTQAAKAKNNEIASLLVGEENKEDAEKSDKPAELANKAPSLSDLIPASTNGAWSQNVSDELFGSEFMLMAIADQKSVNNTFNLLDFGSYKTEDEAKKKLEELKTKYADSLKGLNVVVVEKSSGDSSTYHINAGILNSKEEAVARCKTLTAKGIICRPVETKMMVSELNKPAPAPAATAKATTGVTEEVVTTPTAEAAPSPIVQKAELPAMAKTAAAAPVKLSEVDKKDLPVVASNIKNAPAAAKADAKAEVKTEVAKAETKTETKAATKVDTAKTETQANAGKFSMASTDEAGDDEKESFFGSLFSSDDKKPAEAKKPAELPIVKKAEAEKKPASAANPLLQSKTVAPSEDAAPLPTPKPLKELVAEPTRESVKEASKETAKEVKPSSTPVPNSLAAKTAGNTKNLPVVESSLKNAAALPSGAKTTADISDAQKLADAKKAEAEKAAADKKAAQEKLVADKKAAEEQKIADKKAAQEKLAAEKKEAEEKKIADKKAAEEKKLADKQEAEEKLAAQKKEAEEKKLAEKQAKEEKKIAESKAQPLAESKVAVSESSADVKNLPKLETAQDKKTSLAELPPLKTTASTSATQPELALPKPAALAEVDKQPEAKVAATAPTTAPPLKPQVAEAPAQTLVYQAPPSQPVTVTQNVPSNPAPVYQELPPAPPKAQAKTALPKPGSQPEFASAPAYVPKLSPTTVVVSRGTAQTQQQAAVQVPTQAEYDAQMSQQPIPPVIAPAQPIAQPVQQNPLVQPAPQPLAQSPWQQTTYDQNYQQQAYAAPAPQQYIPPVIAPVEAAPQNYAPAPQQYYAAPVQQPVQQQVQQYTPAPAPQQNPYITPTQVVVSKNGNSSYTAPQQYAAAPQDTRTPLITEQRNVEPQQPVANPYIDQAQLNNNFNYSQPQQPQQTQVAQNSGGEMWVTVGYFTNQSSARGFWNRIAASSGNAASSYHMKTERPAGGSKVSAKIGPIYNVADAQSLCNTVSNEGLSCTISSRQIGSVDKYRNFISGQRHSDLNAEASNFGAVGEEVGTAAFNTWSIQLGTFDSKEAAEGSWEQLTMQNSSLSGLDHKISTSEASSRMRLRAGKFSSTEAAQNVCEELRRNYVSCIVVRSS